jgi:hypothetical protein
MPASPLMAVVFMFGTLYGPLRILIRLVPGILDFVGTTWRRGAAPGGSATRPPFPAIPQVRHWVVPAFGFSPFSQQRTEHGCKGSENLSLLDWLSAQFSRDEVAIDYGAGREAEQDGALHRGQKRNVSNESIVRLKLRSIQETRSYSTYMLSTSTPIIIWRQRITAHASMASTWWRAN